MTWNVSEREFEALTGSDGPVRYEYFIKRVADWEQAWTLGSSDDFVSGVNDSGVAFVPIWPHLTYAEACRDGPWAASSVIEIRLRELLDEVVPDLSESGILVAVFPLANGSSVLVPPERLANDLSAELERYE